MLRHTTSRLVKGISDTSKLLRQQHVQSSIRKKAQANNSHTNLKASLLVWPNHGPKHLYMLV